MNQALSRLLIRCLILFSILFIADRIIGNYLEHLFYKQKHGDDAVSLYTIDSTHEDLLIFGSSRASHHYKTRQLEQALGFPVYNCGRDEMGISYTAAVLPLVYQRYNPKYVIVEVLPVELSKKEKTTSETHISAVLLPFANKYPSLWPTVAFAGADEVYKSSVSRIYPYNSLLGSMIQNTYTHIGHSTDRGYEPLYKTIDTATYKKSIWGPFSESNDADTTLSTRFASILDVAKAHGTQVFVVVSPLFFYQDVHNNRSYMELQRLSAEHQAIFLNYSDDPRFLGKAALFNDDVHLNDTGAGIYSGIIADTLLKLIPSVGQQGFTK